jgi:hypothetical protein
LCRKSHFTDAALHLSLAFAESEKTTQLSTIAALIIVIAVMFQGQQTVFLAKIALYRKQETITF